MALLLLTAPEMREDPPEVAGCDFARDILEFCARHVESQDTVEGIAHWWLLQHRVEWTVMEVKAALAKLVDQGLILERTGPDGRSYYRVNRRKMKRIERMLGGECNEQE